MIARDDPGPATFSCEACAYASPLPPPFDDWIWCAYPGDGRALNLATNADCRHASGGRARTAHSDRPAIPPDPNRTTGA